MDYKAEMEKRESDLFKKIRITVDMYLNGLGPAMGYQNADAVLRYIQKDYNDYFKWAVKNDPGD